MAYNLTAAALREMFDLTSFAVPDDDLVFVGLRGTSPIAIDGTDFAASHKVEDKGINYLQMRCSLIQWKPKLGTFAIFPASTVPHRNTVSSHISSGGQGVNKLASCFLAQTTNMDARYYKGNHGHSSPYGPHRAFRNDTKLPIWRTGDDADYEGDDTLQYVVAYDNIHCARQPDVSASVYSSNGCQVIAGVAGNPISSSIQAEQGPWKKFIRNAYGSSQSKFCYALFEEGEAQRAVELGVAGRTPTVRFGSRGQLVKALQSGLLAKGYDIGPAGADGDFGFATLTALRAFQLKEFGKGAVDLIVGALTAEKLDIEWPSSLSEAHEIELRAEGATRDRREKHSRRPSRHR